MTLLDPPAEKPEKSRAMAFTIAALVLVAIVVLWFTFRYYPEKKAAEHFFDALVAGDTARAYHRRLGSRGLLRPGEELQDSARQFPHRGQRHRRSRGHQSVFAHA